MEDDEDEPRDLVLSAVDRGLDVFGSSVRFVVYYELKKEHGIEPEEIPDKPELLVATIEKIFGQGAEKVSSAICKELQMITGIEGLAQKDLLTALRSAYDDQLSRKSA